MMVMVIVVVVIILVTSTVICSCLKGFMIKIYINIYINTKHTPLCLSPHNIVACTQIPNHTFPHE